MSQELGLSHFALVVVPQLGELPLFLTFNRGFPIQQSDEVIIQTTKLEQTFFVACPADFPTSHPVPQDPTVWTEGRRFAA
jgi:hypothetical protein